MFCALDVSVLVVLLINMLSVVPSALTYEIAPITQDMRNAAADIINFQLPTAVIAQQSSVAWQRLAYICDTFGPRFSGSKALEDALTHIRDTALSDGLTVTEEFTYVPKWVRGEEWATMLQPRVKKLHMIGLGMSNNTAGKNVTAEVIVFTANSPTEVYNEMIANCSKAKGKIILFNTIFSTYGATVPTRSNAAVWAAQCGAVAVLIRSIGPFSMQNPHTGYSIAGNIAAAAISNEDAAQMDRMQGRGQKIIVSLYMDNMLYPPSLSRNLLIDLVGTEKPDEIVLVSGHGDSWDIAEGAMDDGGGFMTSWEAVRTLKMLGLKPKRTIRAVVWVNEENGDKGGQQYYIDKNASGSLAKHSIAIETDGGIFSPQGLGVSCADTSNGGCGMAIAQLKTLAPLLDSIGGGIVTPGGGGADIDPMCETGIVCAGFNVLDQRLGEASAENNPCTVDAMGAWSTPSYDVSSLKQYNSGYFWFHHSQADTMETIDPTQINRDSAVLAIWCYSIAQLPDLLPRNSAAPSDEPTSTDNNNNKADSESIILIVVISVAVIGGAIGMYYYDSKDARKDPEYLLSEDKPKRSNPNRDQFYSRVGDDSPGNSNNDA